MGWDCTHHLVDPERIRTVLVPRLLGRSRGRTAFDRREDATRMWAGVRDGLGGDPDRAAATLCRLAVIWSAEELPHRYLRGIGFSLWDRIEDAGLAAGPPADDPEPMFAEVVEAHPALRGRFPTMFGGNGETGVYISPERVGAARDWLARRLAELPRDSADQVEPIARVLAVAQERGLGYWEATDLPVAQTNAEWLKVPPAAGVTEIPLPWVPQEVSVRAGRAWIGLTRKGCVVIDLATGRQERFPDRYPRSVALRPDGRPVGHCGSPGRRWVAATLDETYHAIPLPDPSWSLARLAQVGDEIYGWPSQVENFPLLRLADEGWVPVDGFPPGRLAGPRDTLCTGGADVLVWNGVIHQRVEGSWRELPVTVGEFEGGPPTEEPVRTGDGALWLKSGKALCRVEGDELRPVVADASMFSAYAPTRGGDLACTHYGGDELWVFLLSPDGSVRSLSREDLGAEKGSYTSGVFVHDDQVWLLAVRNVVEGSILRIPLDRFRAAEPRALP